MNKRVGVVSTLYHFILAKKSIRSLSQITFIFHPHPNLCCPLCFISDTCNFMHKKFHAICEEMEKKELLDLDNAKLMHERYVERALVEFILSESFRKLSNLAKKPLTSFIDIFVPALIIVEFVKSCFLPTALLHVFLTPSHSLPSLKAFVIL